MNRNAQGGTRMYCPYCDEVTTCKAIYTKYAGEKEGETGQRLVITKHPDLHFFRRGRQCLNCEQTWLTAEVNEDFLDELIDLRDALSSIKTNVETYVKESQRAAIALKKLSKSLKILKDSNIYQTATIDEDQPDEEDFS